MTEHPGLTDKQLSMIPPLTDKMTVPGMYEYRAAKHPGSIIAEKRSPIGGWRPVTTEEFLAQVEVYARGLIGLGVEPGEAVALLAANSYQWMVLDVAVMSVGAVLVPIYESDSAKQIGHILRDAKVKLVFTDNVQQADLVKSVSPRRGPEVLILNQDAERVLHDRARSVAPVEVTIRKSRMRIDDLATIIYTSGTTGTPKGVQLTHRNFVGTTIGVHEAVYELAQDPETRILLFLPLAHVLARFVMHAIGVGAGRAGFSPDTNNLVSDIASFQPSVLLVVPRVLEKVYNSAQAKAGPGLKGKIFSWAARQAKDKTLKSEQQGAGGGPLTYAVADALVLKKVKKVLGPRLKYVVSGGAPLAKDLANFYRGLGITLMQGYGLSESTGPITVQRPDFTPGATVGEVLPLNEVKIDPKDGEVLLRGVSVFPGYHNLPKETAKVFTDGWFRTGDLGTLAPDGQLTITGRKKELIVTAGGKNVSPEVLEDLLATHPLIGHVVVVGDAKPFIGALVTLDPEMLPSWLQNKGLPVVDPVTAAELPEVKLSLETAIGKANSHVSRAESIREFRIVNESFTVENGYLTPSMKLKRTQVLNDFSDEVDRLYNGNR